MLKGERNSFGHEGWSLRKISEISPDVGFDCGNADLNEYFQKDVIAHREQLLAETYAFTEATAPGVLVALCSLCNDAAKFQKIQDSVALPESKRYPFLPAVKIARFGVHVDFQGKNFGTFALNMVKAFFLKDNRTGCRLITVDAYNEPRVLRFYRKNDFQFFDDKDGKQTRPMFFDLKRFQP